MPASNVGPEHALCALYRATVPSSSAYAVFLATAIVLLLIPGPAVLYVVTRRAAFDAVKYVGAAYLFLLGARRLLGRGLEEPGEEPVPRTRRRAYAQGVVVNLTNPKTIVFIFAFLPQFVDPSAPHPGLQVLALGLSFALLGFLSDSMWAVAAGTVADRLRGSAGIAWVQRWIGGGVLVGLGILAAVWSVVWSPGRAR